MLLDVFGSAAPHLRAPAFWHELQPRVHIYAVRYVAIAIFSRRWVVRARASLLRTAIA